MDTLIHILLAPFNWAGEKLANAAFGSFHVAGSTGDSHILGSHQRNHRPAPDDAGSFSSEYQFGMAGTDSDASTAPAETELWPLHSMNVDGTPMFGNVDINGNPFGTW